MSGIQKIIPIYTTAGDIRAFLVYPNIYNYQGDWIGFVQPDRNVYSVLGNYVGWLTDDPRVLRKRTYDFTQPRVQPPTAPMKIRISITMRLAPLMSELRYDTIDVLMDEPERLHILGFGDTTKDME
ncbi:MAG: hypothetical protein JXA19_00865 [Anaerolineales bacterium]|nr:hypothetical protein [Anaerolineales bacterium]